MPRDWSPREAISLEELTELLAEATDTSPEELERRAAEMEFPRRTRQPSSTSRLPHFAYGRRSLVSPQCFRLRQ